MNANLYNGLKARINASVLESPGVPRMKYISMWNNQLKDTEEGKIFDYDKPALFFEFIPSSVDTVGGGVQVFDPLLIKVHIIHQFFNADNGANELNLDVFDVADAVHYALQLYQVQGVDYGTSPLNRIEVELDTDHDNLYHHIITYSTTWTDNSAKEPRGGYEIDPPLDAAITAETLDLPYPSITVNPTSLNFGDVDAGEPSVLSFTIAGENLSNVLRLSVSDTQFKISLTDSFKNTIDLAPVNGTISELTINVQFIPTSTGAKVAHINYGVPGTNGEIALTGTGT